MIPFAPSFFYRGPSGRELALGLFLIIVTPPVAAQDVTPGAKAGLTFMTHGGPDAAEDLDWRIGGTIGGFAIVDLRDAFALRPELAYIQKGAIRTLAINGTTFRSTLRTDYLEFSALGTFRPQVDTQLLPSVLAGPTLGYNVRAETEDEWPEQAPRTDVSDQVRRVDVGLAVGGGVDVPWNSYTATIDLRYEVSLTSFYRGDATVRNQGFVLTAGVTF